MKHIKEFRLNEEFDHNNFRKQIIDAYIWIRKNNHTIPDDVLDFMKVAALEKLDKNETYPNLNQSDTESAIKDLSYWKQYEESRPNDDSTYSKKITDVNKLKNLIDMVKLYWEKESDVEDNIPEETMKNVVETSKKFLSKFGYINGNIITAMISQL